MSQEGRSNVAGRVAVPAVEFPRRRNDQGHASRTAVVLRPGRTARRRWRLAADDSRSREGRGPDLSLIHI
eukprot:4046886-Alexandrium_andersonii.AAC.2